MTDDQIGYAHLNIEGQILFTPDKIHLVNKTDETLL